MGIRRTQLPFESDFVQIPNAWLRDEKLSRRARGLLAELMTHRAGWHITIASLQKTGPEGRDAIRGAILELVGCGYLVRRQSQGDGGRFNEIEYEINDPTGVGKSDTGGSADVGSADVGFSDVGESATKNTISQKTSSTEDHRRGALALSPFCSRHPNGTDRPCGPCGTARAAVALARKVTPIRTTPQPPLFADLETGNCTNHPGWPIVDGACAKCERIRLETGAA